jgi:hypothetical protein
MIKSFQVEQFLPGLGYLNDELKFAASSPFIDVIEQAFSRPDRCRTRRYRQLDPAGDLAAAEGEPQKGAFGSIPGSGE